MQGTSTRAGQRPASARAGASERRARRSAAARLAAAPPSGQDAAEAEGALDRFTTFLEHHENELQPRTRQVFKFPLHSPLPDKGKLEQSTKLLLN